MERTGEVTAVKGEWLEVTFCRPTDCEKCNACNGGKSQTTLMVKGEARVGDGAVVQMPMKTVMQASALAYLLPLAGLMLGLFLGAGLFPAMQEVAAVVGGLIGLGVALVYVALTEKRRRADTTWQPTLLEIIPHKEGEQNHGN